VAPALHVAAPDRKGWELLTAKIGRVTRPRYAAGVCASVLLLPAFLLRSWGTEAAPPAFEVSAAVAPPSTWVHPARIVSEPTPAAVASPVRYNSPTPASPTTTVAEVTTRVAPQSTTTTLVVTTSTLAREISTTTTSGPARTAPPTTRPPSTTTTTRPIFLALPALGAAVGPAAKPPLIHSDRGLASWFNAPDQTCAHRTVPKGTEIKVTRVSTGMSTTCEVADWGPADTTRLIDLSMDTFEQLAYADAGLIDVIIEW
jgi:rare lipoprotein A